MREALKTINDDVVISKGSAIEIQQASNEMAVQRPDREVSLLRRVNSTYAPVTKMSRLLQSGLAKSFIACVILLPLLYSVYLAFFASDRYTTEFRVAVKTVDTMQQAGLTALLGMGLGGASSTTYDANAIVQYLKSLQGVGDIDNDIGLKNMYANNNIDFFSRLGEDAPAEKILRYWNQMIKVYYETSTGTIIVKVDAFTPQDSLEVAASALKLSENLVNGMSEKARNESVSFAQREVTEAEQRLARATDALTLVMNQEGTLNPQMSAQSIVTSSTRLRDALSELNAKLAVQRANLSESSPTVTQTKIQIKAIEEELAKLNSLVTGRDKNNRPLSATLSKFTKAESERAFAEKAYQGALTALETARIDAARRQAYLATIVRPQLAEEQSYPHVFFATCTAAAICFLIWIVGSITISAVKEHM